MLRVGIDFSLSSPALYAMNSKNESFILSFQQRKTDPPLVRVKVSDTTWLWRLPYPLTVDDRWEKVIYIISEVFRWLDEIREGAPVHAYIEHYALGMSHSDSVSKLCELGGVLRHELGKRRWAFRELAVSTVKKQFASYGHAEKWQMYESYKAYGYPELSETLSCETHQHPYEDIVDACAVLVTGLILDKYV